MRQALSCIFVLLTLALTGVPQAWGRLTVSPSLTLREEYNDNIYLEKDGEEDFITTVAPSLSATLNTRSLNLDLNYGFVFRLHSNESELDETDPGDSQRALANMDLFPDRDFTVNVLDEFNRVVVDERRPTIEENVVVNRTNFNRFLVNPRYRWRRWQTFTATVSYEYEKRSYDSIDSVSPEDSLADDSERHGGGLDLDKRFSERLSVSTGYNRSVYRTDTETDYLRDDYFAGFVLRPGPKLTLYVQGGVAIIDEEDESETTVILPSILADYAQTREIHLGLEYGEALYDSVSFGLVKGKVGRIYFGKGQMERIYLGKGRMERNYLEHSQSFPNGITITVREEDYLDIDREDFSILAALSTTVTLSNRVSIGVNPYVTWYEFRPEDDDVLRYGLGLSIQRKFKYGYLRFGYKYHAGENDRISDDYRNNIVFLEATMGF